MIELLRGRCKPGVLALGIVLVTASAASAQTGWKKQVSKHGDVTVTKQPQHPPQPTGHHTAGIIVDDHLGVIVHALIA